MLFLSKKKKKNNLLLRNIRISKLRYWKVTYIFLCQKFLTFHIYCFVCIFSKKKPVLYFGIAFLSDQNIQVVFKLLIYFVRNFKCIFEKLCFGSRFFKVQKSKKVSEKHKSLNNSNIYSEISSRWKKNISETPKHR